MTKTAKTFIKTRATLTKVCELIKVIPEDVSGRGKTLRITFKNDRDYDKFRKSIDNTFRAINTGWGGWVVQLNQGPLPGSEHDYCNVASRHHY